MASAGRYSPASSRSPACWCARLCRISATSASASQRVGPQLHQHPAGLLLAAAHHQPAGAGGAEHHADEEHGGGYGAEAEHPLPGAGGGEGVADGVGGEDADVHRQLVQRGDPAPQMLRRQLAQIDQTEHVGQPDGEAEHEPADHERGGVRREAAADRAEHEDRPGQDEQMPAVPATGGERAADDGGQRSEQQQAGDQPLPGGVQAELVGQRLQCPGDRPRVVAVQEAGEAPEHGDPEDSPGCLLPGVPDGFGGRLDLCHEVSSPPSALGPQPWGRRLTGAERWDL